MRERPLNEILLREPESFEFFQSVRLLEKVYTDRKPVGTTALPHEEIVRFRSRVTLDFPSSQIHEFREIEDEDGSQRIEMLVNFMGMVGPSGALPTYYTELVMDRIRYRDTALWTFLDIFGHRLVSLFFRAWAKYRFPVAYDRGDEGLTSYIFDLAGLGTKGLRGRMDVPDESLLPYAGLIAQKPHSSTALTNIVSDYFGVPARSIQFFGQWLDLTPSDLTRVGKARNKLGETAIAGSRIWDQQSKFRLRLGPLALEKFQDFLPFGKAHKALKSVVDFIIGFELDYDVQLCLAKDQVPKTILTTRAMRKPMLGWTSFLKTQPSDHDDDQLVLDLRA